jgi:choline dehydrogenase
VDCDVVIVGAGAAGCVLAARLSEDPKRRVLLVEAGPHYPTLADLPPEIASASAPVVSHDWGYVSEPDGLGRSLPLPRARLVGGCAATNAAFALRGSPADYDRWQALGNRGWSFSEVLPVFRRLESDRDFADEWHGSDGPLPIRRVRPEAATPHQLAFLEAAAAAGHPTAPDHNRPWAVGAGPGPRNVGDRGVRISTALAYLAPARGRRNLSVLPQALVDRVVVRKGRATGIRLANPEETIEAGAVVLAAGSYGTPTVLFRSGIGPATELAPLGIELALDLPGVGRNLVDHPLAFIAVPCGPPAEAAPWFHAMVTWHSERSDPAGPPDLFMAAGGPFEVASDQSPTGAVFNLSFALLAPRSRGRVAPSCADPEAPPRIYRSHLEDQEDLVRMEETLRHARRRRRCRRRHSRLASIQRRHLPPPGWYMSNGARCRCGRRGGRARTRTRHRWALGRRRLDHADDPRSADQPSDDHDRRAGRRLDRGGLKAEANAKCSAHL